MSSYTDIFKSTGAIGFVQIVKILFVLIQNKILAIVVGSAGFGIWGMYNTYVELVSAFSTLGIDQSGVREIAKNDDPEEISQTIWIFKRLLKLFALFSIIISVSLSKYISISLFGSPDYQLGVIIVSFTILINGFLRGNIAILNGLRQIRSLAVSQISGVICGSLVSIASILLLGVTGIPIFIVCASFTVLITTELYVRKLKIRPIKPPSQTFKKESISMIRLGIGFSLSSIIYTITVYLSRTYLSSTFDMSAVGIYQASWTISNVYIGIILTAMGVDFLPRLVKVVNDRTKMNQVVNEQLELGVLLSSVGVLGILIYSPIILKVLYTEEFLAGIPIIRWQILGIAMRVFGYVYGYLFIANNKPVFYILTQAVIFFLDYLFLILFGFLFGFDGLGINYFLSYLIYFVFVSFICYKIFGIRFSRSLKSIVGMEAFFITIVWSLMDNFSGSYTLIIGTFILLLYIYWSFFAMKKYMSINVLLLIRNKIRRNRS